MSQVQPTDSLPADDFQAILFGLFSEVGSILATAKKTHREGPAYAGFRRSAEEEFGDALWYFAALCRRLNIRLDEILTEAVNEESYPPTFAANDLVESPISHLASPKSNFSLDAA